MLKIVPSSRKALAPDDYSIHLGPLKAHSQKLHLMRVTAADCCGAK